MAMIRIPCLVAKTNKAGITSWYWQPSSTLSKAGWKAMALGKVEDAAIKAARQRNADVANWKAGEAVPQPVRKREKAGTVAALIQLYEREVLEGKKPDGSPRIADSTAKTYRTSLKRLRIWAGKHPVAFVTRARVVELKKAMLRPESAGGIGHHAAHQTLKMGRTLFKFAMDEDMIGSNPFESFGLAAPEPRDVIWSPPAREAMVLAAYECGQPSIALAIMLGFATGQREQDFMEMNQRQYVAIPEHKMQPEDFATLAAMAEDGIPRGIRVRQRKTGAWVEVPVVGLVRWAIEANIATARANGTTMVLLDDTRRGDDGRLGIWSGEAGQTRFQRDFAEIRDWAIAAALFDGDEDLAADLEKIQFRDLRRTCVVYLGELGLDAHLIAAITGHDIDETQRILKTYMPRTTGRAARAIALASARQAKDEAAKKGHGNG